MQSRLLHHFLIVCERRNITAAAEFLHITQPALTRSIHKLEKTVGAKLFERLPTGVALTSQGEILARRAKLMELEYATRWRRSAPSSMGLPGRCVSAPGRCGTATSCRPSWPHFTSNFRRSACA
jgi:DNA-binding transcriptional LysR family regulator